MYKQFQSTLRARRSDQHFIYSTSFQEPFQSTLRARRSDSEGFSEQLTLDISIHAPRKAERQDGEDFFTEYPYISIHAPRKAERQLRRYDGGGFDYFNPRSESPINRLYISIHAPRKAERHVSEPPDMTPKEISIHAPRKAERHLP